MSQFPVENEPGLYEGINYLLSGPAGLGQNFEGFTTFTPAYIRPAFRAPFTIPLTSAQNPNWYVAPISIGNITVQGNVADSNNFYAAYSTPQSPAPFGAGDRVEITGVDPGFYNDVYTVLSGNVNGIICGANSSYDWTPYPYVSGGAVERNWYDQPTSTDCNALVTIFGPTDRAFISAQLNLDFDWTASTASEFDIVVQINRYRAFPVVGQPGQVIFQFDTTISQKRYHYSTSTAGSDSIESIFTTVIDTPGFGYYYYILEVDFVKQPEYNNSQIGGPAVTGSLVDDWYYYNGTLSSGQIPATEGDYNSYTGITPTTVTGIGSGAVIDIDLYNIEGGSSVYNDRNTDVYVTTAGSDYQVGDQLRVLGTDIGGTSPDNDLVMTVRKVAYPGDALPGQFQVGLRSLTAQVVKE